MLIAGDAFESLDLARLLVVPAAANPLKGQDNPSASGEQRLEMVRLAFADDPRFEVSGMEIERGGLSYTVDTLEALAALNPGAELTLLIGIDSVRTLDKWKRPERVRELAQLAVLSRHGDGPSKDSGEREGGALPEGARIVTTRRIDVSSTEIRARVAAGKSIKGFVAESVERYISAAKLYGSPSAQD